MQLLKLDFSRSVFRIRPLPEEKPDNHIYMRANRIRPNYITVKEPYVMPK
jgi:hypothetical protein